MKTISVLRAHMVDSVRYGKGETMYAEKDELTELSYHPGQGILEIVHHGKTKSDYLIVPLQNIKFLALESELELNEPREVSKGNRVKDSQVSKSQSI